MYVCDDPSDDAIMERVDAADIQGAWQMYQATVEAGTHGEVITHRSIILRDTSVNHGKVQMLQQFSQSRFFIPQIMGFL